MAAKIIKSNNPLDIFKTNVALGDFIVNNPPTLFFTSLNVQASV